MKCPVINKSLKELYILYASCLRNDLFQLSIKFDREIKIEDAEGNFNGLKHPHKLLGKTSESFQILAYFLGIVAVVKSFSLLRSRRRLSRVTDRSEYARGSGSLKYPLPLPYPYLPPETRMLNVFRILFVARFLFASSRLVPAKKSIGNQITFN